MARKPIAKNVKGKSFSGQIPDFSIRGGDWRGVVTAIKNQKEIAKGAASDSLNWITGQERDNIQLRRGSAILGVTRQLGAGAITGLGIGYMANQKQIPFFTYGRKINYYDNVTNDNIQAGTNIIPVAATGDAFSIGMHQNLAGYFVYISSPNSSAYKIPVANPGSVVDLAQTKFRGNFTIKESRTFLFNTFSTSGGVLRDKTNLYLSYVDRAVYGGYAKTTAESVGTGDGTTKTFTSTLAAVTGVKTCFGIVVTAGTEIVYDDLNGAIASPAGSTGTINYATGALSVTFAVAPALSLAITVTYNTEDSTSQGIWDFSFTAAPNRTAGQGNFFLQAEGGGNLLGVANFNSANYCFHQYKTWVLTNTSIDTAATNLLYRGNLGIPGPLSFDEYSEFIPYLDLNNKQHPRLSKLKLDLSASGSATVVPKSMSDQLDISGYGFDQPVVKQWGDFVAMGFQTVDNNAKNNPFNNRLFLLNRISGEWDIMDYITNNAAVYNGTLLAGDAISNNVYQLFTGFDDDGSVINNFRTSGELNLGVNGRKRFMRLVLDGLISINQQILFYISYDNSPFNLLATINGNGTYVDFSAPQTIGSSMVGSKAIGDGTPSGGSINAYHFRDEIIVGSQVFEYCKIKVVAQNIGWAQISEIIFRDVRYKGRRVSSQYAPINE